jgi:site-specific DNA-adenine methylase
MNKNHFFTSYFGNKRTECGKIYEQLKDKLDEVDYIIEPFCGSSAISYYISLKHPKKFKYILNDNNKHLMECYEIFKDEIKLNKFIDDLNKLMVDITKEKYNILIKEDRVENWFIKQKIYCIRPGLFPNDYEKRHKKDFKYLLDAPIIKFLRTEEIEFINDDAIELINKYKDDEKALIILDPPYVQLNNDFYLEGDTNIYEYLYKNNIKDMTSKILLILEDNWIIKLLFPDTVKQTYDKIYQTNKKKTSHIIVSNF